MKVSPLTILIVEDDPSIREAVSDLLQSEGFSVKTARHGLEALEVLQQDELPGLVFLDHSMPIMDGQECLDIIRENERTSSLPVILVSASAHIAQIEGATAFLKKPFDLETIIQLAHDYCKK